MSQRLEAAPDRRGPPAAAPPAAPPGAPGPWIAGPRYDALLFLGAPWLALALGAALRPSGLSDWQVGLWGYQAPLPLFLIGAFVAAHLVLVLVRSHLNREVFRRHPLRFTLVPLLLLALVGASTHALVLLGVVSLWWDVYHSSLQTFGLGRIYELRAGNDVTQGRRWDLGLNLLLYVGPILGGAALLPHLQSTLELSQQASWSDGLSALFARAPVAASEQARTLTWVCTGAGLVFLCAYLWAQVRLVRAGQRVSWQKVALYASTGLCSLLAWGQNAFGEAFFIMNFFHALQYFGIVWWAEGRNLRRLLRLPDSRAGAAMALSALLWSAALYGVVVLTLGPRSRALTCLALVVALMHFWYDGFVWSVQRRMV